MQVTSSKLKGALCDGVLAELHDLLLQAVFYVQQVIYLLFELLLRGLQGAELLVLDLQVVLGQSALLDLLLDPQRQVLHLGHAHVISVLLLNQLFSFFSFFCEDAFILFLSEIYDIKTGTISTESRGLCIV